MRPRPINRSNQIHHTKKKRHSFIRVIIIFLLCVIIGIFCAHKLIDGSVQTALSKNIVLGEKQLTVPAKSANQLQLNNINLNSTHAVLMDLEKGEVLFDKNGTTKMYPASMTKIMTAIVVLEHIDNLNEKVLLSREAFRAIHDTDAVTAGFLPSESVRTIDLLYGLLLPSGAECALGLAEHIADSESSFVELMNDKAQEIGMKDSHFTNPTGLHDNNHYSTAMDMAILFRYALENETFYKIITSSRYSTPATNQHHGGITFHSTLFSKIDSPKFTGGTILGGKTGFTYEAGQCLASLALKDGKKYILVTSGAATDDNQTEKLHIDDAFKVYKAIGE